MYWARIFKRLRGSEINLKESLPSAYVAWLAGSITLFVVPARRQATDSIPGILKRLQIRAL